MQDTNGKARFVVENYGESELAKRFGVTRYPAIFVNDVLVATPSDFGFYGTAGGSGGRYAPIRKAESHARFRADLARMIDLVAAGRELKAVAEAPAVAHRPAVPLTDLTGAAVAPVAGRPMLVEFWATWCPPCRGTLQWLGELKKRHGDALDVVAIAIESDEADVRRIAGEMKLPVPFVLGKPEVAQAFGDLSAVPTLFLFDGDGRTAGVFYGAPPTLHADVEAKLARLLRR